MLCKYIEYFSKYANQIEYFSNIITKLLIMSVKERLKMFIKSENLSNSAFEKSINASNGYINSISKSIGLDKIDSIVENYSNLSLEWLLTGEGAMLKSDVGAEKGKNLIPLYEDVSTIGGASMVADTGSVYTTSLQIDAGDWFNGATAAIRHYGDSMTEYQSGCILAIAELKDKNEIIWGRNYVVETSEMRITKKIAEIDPEHINCYSTNNETYPDGTLIHQPIKICKANIRRLSKVLGSVNKEESTGQVQLL